MRWTVGLGIGFAILFAVNALFLWFAVTGAEDLDPSYAIERR